MTAREEVSDPTGPLAPGSLASRFLPWIGLGVYALCCLFWWAGDVWYPEWDSAIYLLTAQSIAAGEGYSYLGKPFFLRPPGFSWLLSFFAGSGGFDFQRVNTTIMALATGTTAAVYFAVRVHGRPWLALGAALLTGTSPLFVANFNWVQSEYLFTSLFFCAVGALHRSAEKRPRWWLWALCGSLALTASIHVRTLGILLLPAIAIAAVSRRSEGGFKRALLPLGLVVVSCLPWMLHAQSAMLEAERPSEQLLLFDYPTAIFHVDPGDPDSPHVSFSDWMKRISTNGGRMAQDLASTTLGSDATWAVMLVSALLAAGAVGVVLSGPSSIAWFSVLGAMLMLCYFTYSSRLLLPFVPCAYIIVLVAVERAVQWLARVVRHPSLVPIGGTLIVGILLAVNTVAMPGRLDPTSGDGDRARRLNWQSLTVAANWLRENTPTDAIILCNQAPILSYLSGRRAYTYRFIRTPDPLTRYDVDYVVFDAPHSGALAKMVRERAGDTKMIRTQSRSWEVKISTIRKPAQAGEPPSGGS